MTGDVSPGTHINAIVVYKPHEREIPAATVAGARVVVDSVCCAQHKVTCARIITPLNSPFAICRRI